MPMSYDFHIHRANSSKPFVSLRKIETTARSEAGKERLVIAAEPDERRNRGDPLSRQPAVADSQCLNRLNRSRGLGDLCEQDQIASIFGDQLTPDRSVQEWILLGHDEVIARRMRVVNRMESIRLKTIDADALPHHRRSCYKPAAQAHGYHMKL